MFLTQYLLFYILLMLLLGAVIAFSYFVIKPLQTRWAIAHARRIVAQGNVPDTWQVRNVHRMLATANSDLEAAYLWHRLREIREKTL